MVWGLLVSCHGAEGVVLGWVVRVLAGVALGTTWIVLWGEWSRHVVGEPSGGAVSRLVRAGAGAGARARARARACLVSRTYGGGMAVEACPLLPPPHLLCHLYHLGVGTDVSLRGWPLQVLPVGQRFLSLEEG